MQKPSLGRVVIALVEPKFNNGADVAPAEVVRVWNERPDGSWLVNIKANLDGEGSRWMASVVLVDTEEQAREVGAHVAFWPARV